MSTMYFTSDTHFLHENILTLGSGRPFKTIDEHDQFIVDAWNARINKGDRVFHLGDFMMGDRRRFEEFFRKLNGRIFMVLGNHDRPRGWENYFEHVCKRFELDTKAGKILMRHAPNSLDPWSQGSRDLVQEEPGGFAWFFHGHVHNRWARRGKFVNVGVDVRDFEPKTLDELIAEPGDVFRPDPNPDFPLVVENAPSFTERLLHDLRGIEIPDQDLMVGKFTQPVLVPA